MAGKGTGNDFDTSAVDERKGINSVEVGLRVLEVLSSAGHSLPLKDISRLSGLSGSQSHRYLTNLIRGGSHSGNVAAEDLAKADLLDIVSSDYVPSALLLSAFRLADIWNDLPRAIATVTCNPASAVRLHDRGALKRGLRGDVLRVRKIGGTPLLRGVWSQGNKVG